MFILDFNFDFNWFLTIPGLLITGGVLLLLIALIIFIATSGKAKKEKASSLGNASVVSSMSPVIDPMSSATVQPLTPVNATPVTPIQPVASVTEPVPSAPVPPINQAVSNVFQEAQPTSVSPSAPSDLLSQTVSTPTTPAATPVVPVVEPVVANDANASVSDASSLGHPVHGGFDTTQTISPVTPSSYEAHRGGEAPLMDVPEQKTTPNPALFSVEPNQNTVPVSDAPVEENPIPVIQTDSNLVTEPSSTIAQDVTSAFEVPPVEVAPSNNPVTEEVKKEEEVPKEETPVIEEL